MKNSLIRWMKVLKKLQKNIIYSINLMSTFGFDNDTLKNLKEDDEKLSSPLVFFLSNI